MPGIQEIEVVELSGEETYRYDANGNRLQQKQGTTVLGNLAYSVQRVQPADAYRCQR